MASLSDTIASSAYASRVLSEGQLATLVGGGNARRYGLVNRALKDQSLIRLKRGAYVLAKAMHDRELHPFSIAQGLMPGSYVSFELAVLAQLDSGGSVHDCQCRTDPEDR